MEKSHFVHARNVSSMIWRIKLLSSMLEEIQLTCCPIPPSSIMSFNEILSLIVKSKHMIQECKDGSYLWSLIQLEFISNQFYLLAKDMGNSLDTLPLSSLSITRDTQEQVELLQKQAKMVKLFIDPRDLQQRDRLLHVMANNSLQNKDFVDARKVEEILSNIGLKTASDYDMEISKLEAEARNQASTGGLKEASDIKNLLFLVSYSKSMIFKDVENERNEGECQPLPEFQHIKIHDYCSASSKSITLNIRDEFLCPISLELMRDPVIVSSGHSYDRVSIARWINSGHHTCPKSGQRLIHTALVPNYALKSLIQQWCYENKLPVNDPTMSVLKVNSSKKNFNANSLDAIKINKILIMAAGKAIENIIEVLESGKTMEARQNAAAAIFSLTMIDYSKVTIGGHPRATKALVNLLKEGTAVGKRDAASALFNLAVYQNNKARIVSAGAVSLLIELLMDDKAGITDDALAVLASLVGCSQGLQEIRNSRALVSILIELLRYGSATGKENSITLLLGLCKEEGELVARRLLVNPSSIPSLQSLAAHGSLRARRKADALLRLLNRCCSQPHHSL
ncbi:hypothetical protein Ahy_A10g049959 isoform B [Arachis hypogaea]|uniref:RING-type E3 ubiquitin transferase n=1 Tax=Arachis hypogaea TaxID=3818 RepID=A0A445B8A3_ARAHY|nr:hypothetical protein Ahy_A10g049959 isoform B [Arachis hypogaea]